MEEKKFTEDEKMPLDAPTILTAEMAKVAFDKMFHTPKKSRLKITDDEEAKKDAEMEEELFLLKEWNDAYDKAGGRARAARRSLDRKYGKKGFSIGSYKRPK